MKNKQSLAPLKQIVLSLLLLVIFKLNTGVVFGQQISLDPMTFFDQKGTQQIDNLNPTAVASWTLPYNTLPTSSASNINVQTRTIQPIYQITQIIDKTATIIQGGSPFQLEGVTPNGVVTVINVTDPTVARVVTIPNASGEISLLGQKITGSEIDDNSIDIGAKSEGNWTQNDADDIVLNNTGSELKILGSSGTYFATIDAGAISADTTLSLSGSSGTLLSSTNYSDFISVGGTTAVSAGGTGLTTVPSNGQVLIGNGSGYALSALSTGTGVSVTNGSGTITITNSGVTALNSQTGAVSISGAGINAVGASGGIVTLTATEADTFAAVTGRGSTTSTAVTLNGGVTTTGYIQSSGNIAFSGTGTLSTGTGVVSLNGDTTIATNKNLSLASGTGTVTQTFVNSSGTATTLAVTNSGSSGTNTVKALDINLTGTSGGTNTITGINLGNVTGVGGNSFNAITFGTGLTNLITSPTINITAAGAITGLTGLTLASGNIDQSLSSGTLQTGTGAVSLNGTTTVASGKTLAITTADSLTVGGNKIPQTLFVTVDLLAGLLDKTIFVADASYQITSTRCIYSVGAAVAGTLQVTVETGTSAPGTGTAQLTGTLNLSSTINTAVTGTVTGSPTTIATGDRISADFGGTLTGLLGNCTIGLKRV